MQVPDEIRKCVGFLASRRNSGHEKCGTVFLVGCPLSADEDVMAIYAVTAKHVIEHIKIRSIDGCAYCRLNTLAGMAEYSSIPVSHWVFSEDHTIDVAVAPVSLDFQKYDHKVVPLKMFMTAETLLQEFVGVGDDLFFPGLFSLQPGEERNLPIVRVGNIAAMPEETIRTTGFGILRSPYLVEARSRGGFSGSPVFWFSGMSRIGPDGGMALGPPRFFLLGLVHGHYVDRGGSFDACDATVPDGPASDSKSNMGIAIVVPSHDIRAVLNHPKLEAARKIMQLRLPVPDAKAADLSALFTQEDATPRAETLDSIAEFRSVDTMSGIRPPQEPPNSP